MIHATRAKATQTDKRKYKHRHRVGLDAVMDKVHNDVLPPVKRE